MPKESTTPAPRDLALCRAIQDAAKEDQRGMIRKFDDPALRSNCELVAPGEDLAWTDQLRHVCLSLDDAAGIAAPQLGILKRAIFIRYGREHGMVMINPVLSRFGIKKTTDSEGCLSYPGVTARVERYDSVFCTWDTVEGSAMGREFTGFEARVLQHEIDHLNGVCIVGNAWRARKNKAAAAATILATVVAGYLPVVNLLAPEPAEKLVEDDAGDEWKFANRPDDFETE